MGVYIKGMEMPKDGYRQVFIDSNGTVTWFNNGADGPNTMYKAKAFPVPPHGRLIDASEKIRVQMYDDDMTEDYHIAEMTIDDFLSQGWVETDAPTIIPADKEETCTKN